MSNKNENSKIDKVIHNIDNILMPKLLELMENLELESVTLEPNGLRDMKVVLHTESVSLGDQTKPSKDDKDNDTWEHLCHIGQFAKMLMENQNSRRDISSVLLPVCNEIFLCISNLQSLVDIADNPTKYLVSYNRKLITEKYI